HRLRAGWRIVIQMMMFIAVLATADRAGRLLTTSWGKDIVGSVFYMGLGLVAAGLAARFLDRRGLADYGFHITPGWWLDLGFGAALGAGIMTGIFVTEQLAGWITLSRLSVSESNLSPATALLVSLLVYSAVAFNEELTFRGYQLRNLAEGFFG